MSRSAPVRSHSHPFDEHLMRHHQSHAHPALDEALGNGFLALVGFGLFVALVLYFAVGM